MEQMRENFKNSGVPRLADRMSSKASAVAQALRGGRLHHAYVIEGDKETIARQLADFFQEDLGVSLANNPDYSCEIFDTFGIDEARELRLRQSRVAVHGGGKKIFVISAERVTIEAQNALLKTLEEPTAGTHIFIIMPSVAEMLPTVRSRAVFLRAVDSSSGKDPGRRASYSERLGRSRKLTTGHGAEAFLNASYHEREKFLKSFPEEEARARAAALLLGLQNVIKKRFKSFGNAREYHGALLATEKCREHLGRRAPSVKMLLEYLAVVLPRWNAGTLEG